MSNVIVGNTYQAIINKVLEASENDFLENGVDQGLLDELREGWQKRLSDLKGAMYPWDPAPPQAQNPPTVPSNGPKGESASSQPSQQQQGNYNGGPRIKQEVKQENILENTPQVPYSQPQPAYTSGLNREVAAQRAATFLKRDFGNSAAQSIAALPNQSNINLPGQHRPSHIQLPPQAQQQRQQHMQQQQGMQQGMQQAIQQRQQQANIYPPQTDGADDAPQQWGDHVALMASQSDNDPAGRRVADGLIRQQVHSLAHFIDSGLLVPLDDLPAARQRQLRRAAKRQARLPASSSSSNARSIPQMDGVDSGDDDEKIPDDEAINSDLDDSEDELNENEDDGQEIGDIMLCTYDKVQRVKNKWKCTLKDGILTTNGKDYLFHKATGEIEFMVDLTEKQLVAQRARRERKLAEKRFKRLKRNNGR